MPSQVAEELEGPRDAAGRTLQRLDEHGGDRVAVFSEHRLDSVDVVVGRHDPVVRHVHVAMAGEGDHAAVVAAVEHEHPTPAGVVRRQRECHQVRFGTGVREAHLLDRREACGDQLGEANLVRMNRAECPPAIDRSVSGRPHRPGRMSEEAGGVVAEEVDVAMVVDIDEVLALLRLPHGTGTDRSAAPTVCCHREARRRRASPTMHSSGWRRRSAGALQPALRRGGSASRCPVTSSAHHDPPGQHLPTPFVVQFGWTGSPGMQRKRRRWECRELRHGCGVRPSGPWHRRAGTGQADHRVRGCRSPATGA